jgi:transcriptional regulator with XRE-family HTH domain
MKLRRTSVGLAVKAAREAAGFTLADLAGATSITISSLSRTENGQRDAEFAEIVSITSALRIDVETFRTMAETFERSDAAKTLRKMSKLEGDLNDLQRLAVAAAIEARTRG